MKKLYLFLVSALIISSCASTKENATSSVSKNEKKLQEQAEIKTAVEGRRYILKFTRLYRTYGGIADLISRANYMIVDGQRAIINTAYLGRQYDIKPIAAINMKGRAEDYQVTNKLGKGSYSIDMKVVNGGPNSFNVHIDISKNGYCSASVYSLRIDNIRFSGYLVPIQNTPVQSEEQGMNI
jgi:hypothetical protein